MSIFGIFITYACCWWLVLFMVLPWRITYAAVPGEGHAPSAPEWPMWKQKMLITSVLAVIPTLVIYLLVNSARAAEADMYHAKSNECAPMVAYQPGADVAATDGVDARGNAVAPATMGGQSGIMSSVDTVPIGMNIPAQEYIAPKGKKNPYNADFERTDIQLGDIAVKQNGSVTMNGREIGQQAVYPDGCDPASQTKE